MRHPVAPTNLQQIVIIIMDIIIIIIIISITSITIISVVVVISIKNQTFLAIIPIGFSAGRVATLANSNWDNNSMLGKVIVQKGDILKHTAEKRSSDHLGKIEIWTILAFVQNW